MHGELLEQGKVAETCENVGMKAVCFGDEGSSHDKDSSREMSDESGLTITISTTQVCDHRAQLWVW